MSEDHQRWKHLIDASGGPLTPEPPESASIPWLKDFDQRVRALFFRLLWRRAALVAAVIAAGFLAATCLFTGDVPADSSPPDPELTVPPAP